MIVIRRQQDAFGEILIVSFPELFRQHIKTLYRHILDVRTNTMHKIKLPVDFPGKEHYVLIHHIKRMPFLVSCLTFIAGAEIFTDHGLLGTKLFPELRLGYLGSNDAFLLKMSQIPRNGESTDSTVSVIGCISEIIEILDLYDPGISRISRIQPMTETVLSVLSPGRRS